MKNGLKKVLGFVERHPNTTDCIMIGVTITAYFGAAAWIYKKYLDKCLEKKHET